MGALEAEGGALPPRGAPATTPTCRSNRCIIADVPVDPGTEFDPPNTGPDDPPDPYLREPPAESCYYSLDDILDGVPIELEGKAVRRDIVSPISVPHPGVITTRRKCLRLPHSEASPCGTPLRGLLGEPPG